MVNNTQELASARKALEDGQFDVVLTEAEPFLDSDNVDVRSEAHALTELANFRKANYEDAQKHYHIAVKIAPNINDWISLMTTSILAGDFDTAEDAFGNAIGLRKTIADVETTSIPYIMYYYAGHMSVKKKWKNAWSQVELLRKVYEDYRITDDMFLWMRGVPFLSRTLQLALDVLRGRGDTFDADNWFKSFAEQLDDEGKSLVEEYRLKLKADAQ